jgi:uncharacterized protein (TIGR03083 family)
MDNAYPDKDELMRKIHATRLDLESLIAQLSDAQMLQPGLDGWSVKDHLAHIAAWEQSMLAILNGRPRHEAMGVSREVFRQGVDVVNQVVMERSRTQTLPDVLAEFRRSYQAVLARLDELSDADLRQPYGYYLPNDRDDDTPPVLDWVMGDTYEHYEEHAAYIRALLADA